jgi:hypothetical protein
MIASIDLCGAAGRSPPPAGVLGESGMLAAAMPHRVSDPDPLLGAAKIRGRRAASDRLETSLRKSLDLELLRRLVQHPPHGAI